MTEEAQPGGTGIFGSIRRLGVSLLGLAQTRIELIAVELQEEKLRAVHALVWLGVAFALGLAGVLVAMGALALFLWRTAGYAGLVGLSVVTLVAAAIIVARVRRQIQLGPAPFSATAEEFRKDVACLRQTETE